MLVKNMIFYLHNIKVPGTSDKLKKNYNLLNLSHFFLVL